MTPAPVVDAAGNTLDFTDTRVITRKNSTSLRISILSSSTKPRIKVSAPVSMLGESIVIELKSGRGWTPLRTVTVTATDSVGNTATGTFAVTVTGTVGLTVQPSPLTVASGSSATFSVTPFGSAPFSYQWKKDGANLAGATNASYTIASAQPANGGNYTVVVTNVVGSLVGTRLALKHGAGFVRYVFIAVVGALILKTGYDGFFSAV